MVLENDSGHLMCQLKGPRGTRKESSLSSTHIPAIRFHHILYPPFKRGEEGAYFTLYKKKAIATVKFSYDISGKN